MQLRGNKVSARRTVAAWTVVGLSAMGLAGRGAWAQEPAASADDFVERVGVSTHFGRANSPYTVQLDGVKKLLAEIGVRNVRDGITPQTAEIYNATGVKTTAILLPPDAKAAVKLAAENAQRLAMVEGQGRTPLTVSPPGAPSKGDAQNNAFAERDALFPRALYDALKAEPATKYIPVLASLDAAAVPGQTTVARLSGEYGEALLAGDASPLEAQDRLASGQTLLPLVATLSGAAAHALPTDADDQAQAKQIVRQCARDYAEGVVRTFAGELVDVPNGGVTVRPGTKIGIPVAPGLAATGLVHTDLTPRPAYAALKTLLALLSERTWIPVRQRWQWEPVGSLPSSRQRYQTPMALDVTITGAPATSTTSPTLRHTLLQKQTGDYYLLLWQEGNPPSATPTDVTLTWKTPMRGGAVYDPVVGADPTQIFSGTAGTATVPVADSLLVIQLTPQNPWSGQTLLTREEQIAASATDSTMHLTWRPYGGAAPAGYFVSRQGRFLGRTTKPEFDDTGLRPGIGYTYTIQAYAADGSVGPPVPYLAITKN